MQKLKLVRTSTSDQGTFGYITTPKGQVFKTGELPWRDNHNMLSCIPPTPTVSSLDIPDQVADPNYTFSFIKSDKFPNGTFEASNVPNRSEVRIHIGNWCGDSQKGYAWDVEGCIILGTIQESRNNQSWMIKHSPGTTGFMQAGVFNSTEAIGLFQDEMGSTTDAEPFELEIVELFA